MSQFDDQSIKRISAVVRYVERQQRNLMHLLRTYKRTQRDSVPFELTETYTQWSTTPALAIVRTFDITANDGNGGFVTDCADGLVIKVIDGYETGHNAAAGGLGRCEIRGKTTDGYALGFILDLCCPGDEQGTCTGSGS
ncbi:hypothetical protein [Petrachloros mirabilis]